MLAHGSPVAEANEAVRAVAGTMARAGSLAFTEVAFLEPAHPNLDESVARLAERGVSRVLVIPYFLTLGTHMQRDLPALIDRVAERHQDLEIRATPPLDGHPGLAQILLDRAREALANW